jgi:hypothetical protein
LLLSKCFPPTTASCFTTLSYSIVFSPHNTKFLFETSASASHKNSYYYPSVSHPQQRVVLFAHIKQAREREREREAHHLCTLFKENQNFTEKLPSPLFLQATNY